MQAIQKIIEENRDLYQKKEGQMKGKIKDMGSRLEKIEETCQYFVKVADSCPLAIEQARYNKLTGQIIQLSEIEKEQQK